MQVIGHLGKDAIMQQHGTDNVLNFSIAHTDKYKNHEGVNVEKTTWVECSYWIDGRSTLVQYLKKGAMVYVEGFPGSRPWETREGKKVSNLTMRVFNLQLCGGGGHRDNNHQSQPSQQAPATTTNNDQGGYVPHTTGSDDELPF